jgi:hypothetical protein
VWEKTYLLRRRSKSMHEVLTPVQKEVKFTPVELQVFAAEDLARELATSGDSVTAKYLEDSSQALLSAVAEVDSASAAAIVEEFGQKMDTYAANPDMARVAALAAREDIDRQKQAAAQAKSRNRKLGATGAATIATIAVAVGAGSKIAEAQSGRDAAAQSQKAVATKVAPKTASPPSFSRYSLKEIAAAKNGTEEVAEDLRNVEHADLAAHTPFARHMAVDGARKSDKGHLFRTFGYEDPSKNSANAGKNLAAIVNNPNYVTGQLTHSEKVINSNATQDGHIRNQFHQKLEKGRYVGGVQVSRLEIDKYGRQIAYVQVKGKEVRVPRTDVVVMVDTNGDHKNDITIDATNDLGYNTDKDFAPEKGRFSWIKRHVGHFVCKCVCKQPEAAPVSPAVPPTVVSRAPAPRVTGGGGRPAAPVTGGGGGGKPAKPVTGGGGTGTKKPRQRHQGRPVTGGGGTGTPPPEHVLPRHQPGDGPHNAGQEPHHDTAQPTPGYPGRGNAETVDSTQHGNPTNLDPTPHGTEAPAGAPAQSGEQADSTAQGPANPQYQPGTATEGTNAGTTAPAQTEASPQTSQAGSDPGAF